MNSTAYVVTYHVHDIENPCCQILTGSELAIKYGFSDCNGAFDFKAWEITNNGHLLPVALHTPVYPPFNRLLIEDVCGNVDVYEWEEH